MRGYLGLNWYGNGTGCADGQKEGRGVGRIRGVGMRPGARGPGWKTHTSNL